MVAIAAKNAGILLRSTPGWPVTMALFMAAARQRPQRNLFGLHLEPILPLGYQRVRHP
jgi:hypothetical protein